MNRRGPYFFVVFLLLLAGIAMAIFRHNAYRVPYLPGAAQSIWQVDAKVEFDADDGAVQIVLTLPEAQNGFRRSSENTASPGYGFIIEQSGDQRQARWSKRDADGAQTLFYKLELIEDPGFEVPDSSTPQALGNVTWDEPYRTAVNTLLQAARPQSADGYTLARQLLQRMNTQPLDQNSSLLLDNWSLSELLPRMLVTAEVPARTVSVLDLEDQRRRQSLRELVQVWDDGRWRLIDPDDDGDSVPGSRFLWQTAQPSVLEVTGGTNSRVSF